MKLSEAFPSNYLKSDDLQGRQIPVVIATAEREKVGDDMRLVLSFQNKKKTMICNKTNAKRIAFLYGEETDDWVGKEITIVAEMVEFKGETVMGLRVKPPVRREAPKQQGTATRQGNPPTINVIKDRENYQLSAMEVPSNDYDDTQDAPF